MALTKAQLIDLNGNELILDLDADTSITADTDDQIDIKIGGADDFRFTANTFTGLAGSTITAPTVVGSTSVQTALIEFTDGDDAMTIANGGAVTFAQAPVFPDGSLAVVDLDIDGATDIGAALVDADLLIVDDGAGGTNRKVALSRVKTYIGSSTAADDLTIGDAAVLLTTSAGNITIDAAGNDTDIIFKGTDGSSDRVFMTIDGSAGGDLFLTGGLIDLKNDGSAVSQIKFYCESSNAHAQTLIGAPHSESGTNTLTLPSSGGNSKLLSATSTATVTNKTLTSPVINTGTFGTSILPTSADGTTLGSASKEFSDLFLADASTIQFGADQDVTLTHVADTGLLLNAAMKIQFRDAAIHISSTADGDLAIAADDEIDINGNVEISGTAVTTGVHTFTAVPVFPNNTVESADIQADAITGAKIADDAINSEHYTDGSIDTAHLADGQVTIGKLATAVLTGATDIGAAIVDADLLLVDDGAGGTLRKTAASRLKTYIGSTGKILSITSLGDVGSLSQASTNSTDFADLGNLELQITPLASGSKFNIFINYNIDTGGDSHGLNVRLMFNHSGISHSEVNDRYGQSNTEVVADRINVWQSQNYFLAPNTTNEITFNLQIASATSGQNTHFNRGTCSMIIMEYA